MFLNEIVNNVHKNCHITAEQKSELSNHRNKIKDCLEKNFSGIEILNQGSYATSTQIYGDEDLDIDIGIIFNTYARILSKDKNVIEQLITLYKKLNNHILQRYNYINYYDVNKIISDKPDLLKNIIYIVLNSDPNINTVFKHIKIGKCCVKLKLKNKYFDNCPINIDIAIYKRDIYGITSFAINNKWKLDNKKEQMIYMKKMLAIYPEIRQIVMFLKCFTKLYCKSNECDNPFKSIIILELVAQNYKKNEGVIIGINMLEMLISAFAKLKKTFELNISGCTKHKENLFNNEHRQVDRGEFLNFLENICIILINIKGSFVGMINYPKKISSLRYYVPFCHQSTINKYQHSLGGLYCVVNDLYEGKQYTTYINDNNDDEENDDIDIKFIKLVMSKKKLFYALDDTS